MAKGKKKEQTATYELIEPEQTSTSSSSTNIGGSTSRGGVISTSSSAEPINSSNLEPFNPTGAPEVEGAPVQEITPKMAREHSARVLTNLKESGYVIPKKEEEYLVDEDLTFSGITATTEKVESSRIEKKYLPHMIARTASIMDTTHIVALYSLAMQDTYHPTSMFKNAIENMRTTLSSNSMPNDIIQCTTEVAYLAASLHCSGFSSAADYSFLPNHIRSYLIWLQAGKGTKDASRPTLSRLSEIGFFFIGSFPACDKGLLARKGFTNYATSGPGFEYNRESTVYFNILGGAMRHQLGSRNRITQRVSLFELFRSSIRRWNAINGNAVIGAWDANSFEEFFDIVDYDNALAFLQGYYTKVKAVTVDDANFEAKKKEFYEDLKKKKEY